MYNILFLYVLYFLTITYDQIVDHHDQRFWLIESTIDHDRRTLAIHSIYFVEGGG